MPNLVITSNGSYETDASFDAPFSFDISNDVVKLFLTTKIKGTIPFEVSQSSRLYYPGGNIGYLINPDVEVLNEQYLGIKGKDLHGNTLTIVSTISKINPSGMDINNAQMSEDVNVSIVCELEAGSAELIPIFEVEGKFPLRPVEVFNIKISFT